jgi:hypothetical protein
MNADKGKGKIVLVQDPALPVEATHMQDLIGVHRRSSAVNSPFRIPGQARNDEAN